MPKSSQPKAPASRSRSANSGKRTQSFASPYQARAGQAKRDQAERRPASSETESAPALARSTKARPAPTRPSAEKSKSSSARPAAAASAPGKPFLTRPGQDAVTRSSRASGAPSGTARNKPAGRDTARPPVLPSGREFGHASAPPRATLPVPCAMVTRRASESIRSGHLWVYNSDIAQTELGAAEAPALIPVVDNRGILLGTALYSPTSQITLRLISRELLTQQQWQIQLAERLKTAIHRRLPLLSKDGDACRLVFSEADNLPGLIVDKYAGITILQLLARGLDNEETRATCVGVLSKELPGKLASLLTIWERPDPRIRELEGLSAPATTALFTNQKTPAASTQFHLNGLSFFFDVNSGQKTGAFLDQRQNYLAAANWAKAFGLKKALDVCTYQGGFALHLAQVCDHVTGIDASRASLEVAERNLEANRKTIPAEVDWIEADAFELLRAWSDGISDAPDTAQWDLIVLDPPAFAKSKRAVEGALRGYKELNLRALRMIRPGGLLITCSCSHHVSWTDLEAAVASAATDANRRVTLLERRGAAQDHPVLLNLPETEYLKCLICQVD